MTARKLILVISTLLLATLACNSILPQSESTRLPTTVPNSTQAANTLPQTDDDIPRVSIQDARAALESGEAVVVDVRSAEAFAAEHVAGAISIPLDVIQTNPAGVPFDKDQWIITYCT